jgi:polyhydroxyalkanoate synthase subunit PhaC
VSPAGRLAEAAKPPGLQRDPVTAALEGAVSAAANAFDLVFRNDLGEPSPTESMVVDQGPQRTVRRYRSTRPPRVERAPVLLVPPLAAPISCFDLHRGASLAQHLVRIGYPTYVVDYGPISFEQRTLGLEHWVSDVVPAAVRAASEHAGGTPVQVVGWCLGGIMALLAAAADRRLPIASLALVASPFDFERMTLLGPLRRLGELTPGELETLGIRLMGGIPAPLVSLGFRLTAADRFLLRPLYLARNLSDRQALAHMQAVDRYMANMLAYPGRTIGQLYHGFFRSNELATGRVELGGDRIDVRRVRLPVLAVAGAADMLAPVPSVHHVAELLPRSSEVRLETAPGGHLGALTGGSARRTTWEWLDEFLVAHQPRPRPPANVTRARIGVE